MVIIHCLLLVTALLSTQGTGRTTASESNDVIHPPSNDVRQPDIGPDEHSNMPFYRHIRSPKGLPGKQVKTSKTPWSKFRAKTSQYKKPTVGSKFSLSKLRNSANKVRVQNKLSNLFRSASRGSATARKSLKSLLPTIIGFGTAGAGLATAITQLLAVTRDQSQQHLPEPDVSLLLGGQIQAVIEELGPVGSGSGGRGNDIIVSAVCALLCAVFYRG